MKWCRGIDSWQNFEQNKEVKAYCLRAYHLINCELISIRDEEAGHYSTKMLMSRQDN